MQSIAVCWSVCCSQFADRCQLGDEAAAEPFIWKIERRREAGRRGWGLDEDIDDLVAQQSLPKTAYL
jgi:hypothetical protein